MINWEEKVGAPNVVIFGEPATYIPTTGDPYDVNGVFDDQFRATVVEDGSAPNITDSLPVFGVNAAQFQATPQQGDQVQFPANAFASSGRRFIVMEPRPDRHGIFHLALTEVAPP